MEIKNYYKKRLYNILRSALIGCANVSVFSHLINTYFEKDELEVNQLLLKLFSISKQEFNDFLSFESYPRDFISSRPSFYTLGRNDMCNIIKNLILKLNDENSMSSLKDEVENFIIKHPNSKYFAPLFLLELFELKASEYNEIINFEESLFLQGTEDNGLDELTEETRELIKKFLIPL